MNRMQMIDTAHLNALRDRIYNIRFAGNWKLLFGSIGYNLYIARQLIKVWGRGNEMLHTDKSGFTKALLMDHALSDEEWFAVQFSNYVKDTREDMLACTAICFFHWAGRKQLDLSGISKSLRKDYSLAKDFIGKLSFNEDINFAFSVFFNRKVSSLQEKVESSLICLFLLAEKHNIDLLWHIHKRLEYAECKGALRKLPVNFNTRCRNRL